MRMLDFTEAQRSRQRVNCGDRRTDGPALFQPDVPIDADSGEFGDLLTPQAWGSAPSHIRKPDGLRTQPLAPRSQEIAEFAALRVCHGCQSHQDGIYNPRIIPGLTRWWKSCKGGRFTQGDLAHEGRCPEGVRITAFH